MRSDTYRLAEMADPDKNFHFRRRWGNSERLSPAQIDRLADHHLQRGHHLAAETLSRHAADLREALA